MMLQPSVVRSTSFIAKSPSEDLSLSLKCTRQPCSRESWTLLDDNPGRPSTCGVESPDKAPATNAYKSLKQHFSRVPAVIWPEERQQAKTGLQRTVGFKGPSYLLCTVRSTIFKRPSSAGGGSLITEPVREMHLAWPVPLKPIIHLHWHKLHSPLSGDTMVLH